jgi:hypothetical protein
MTAYTEIHNLIKKWYGMELPITIRTRAQDISEFQKDHPEIPAFCYDHIDQNMRLVLLWSRSNVCVDLIVRYDGRLRMVQDICFRDAYDSVLEFYRAIKELLDDATETWVVYHYD